MYDVDSTRCKSYGAIIADSEVEWSTGTITNHRGAGVLLHGSTGDVTLSTLEISYTDKMNPCPHQTCAWGLLAVDSITYSTSSMNIHDNSVNEAEEGVYTPSSDIPWSIFDTAASNFLSQNY